MRLAPLIAILLLLCGAAPADEQIFPPLAAIKPDRPRLLLRPKSTRLAVSLAELRNGPKGADFNALLQDLRRQDDASAQAMVWLLADDPAAARKAIDRMRAYQMPAKANTFEAWFRLREFALAYDWLYTSPDFTPPIRAQVRKNIAPLVEKALALSDDHIFHNYVWMSSGGLALWALATAGEDAAANQLYATIQTRFNQRLFPALRYQDGMPSEPMGYWSFYVFTPSVLSVLAAQSASDIDLVSAIHQSGGNWFENDLENVVHFTLPDMRFMPWGDLQAGSNGGVTQEMAGIIDAATWVAHSSDGRWLGQWLAAKRGLGRFKGQTPIFYMIYSRQIAAHGAPRAHEPALSHLGGDEKSGEFAARSGWGDGDTIVGFRCADFFGDHNHYDQGSFIIYRRGLLAIDPPIYNQTRGPQGETQFHNTLLIGGKPQREARGQTFRTLESFVQNLNKGKRLETGQILQHRDAGQWVAISGQFAQAYDCPELKSCVRQLLFLRPGTIVVVDQLDAFPGQTLPQIQWLLQLPAEPAKEDNAFAASNGKAWIRCRPIATTPVSTDIAATPMKTHRLMLTYPGQQRLLLAHVLEIGDGTTPPAASRISMTSSPEAIQVIIGAQRWRFTRSGSFSVDQP